MSFSLQSPSPFGVMFGTQPSPSGLGPPAKRLSAIMPPRKLRGLWHSAQWPSALTRQAPRFHGTERAGSGANGLPSMNSNFQMPKLRRILNENGTSWSRTLPDTGGC